MAATCLLLLNDAGILLVSVPYSSGQWLQRCSMNYKRTAAQSFSPLFIGSMAATLKMQVKKMSWSVFQSPIHRVNGCNAGCLYCRPLDLVQGFQSPIHRVNGCNYPIPSAA